MLYNKDRLLGSPYPVSISCSKYRMSLGGRATAAAAAAAAAAAPGIGAVAAISTILHKVNNFRHRRSHRALQCRYRRIQRGHKAARGPSFANTLL